MGERKFTSIPIPIRRFFVLDDNSDGILVSEANFDLNVILSSDQVEMGITGTAGVTYSGIVTIYSAEQNANDVAVTPLAKIYDITSVTLPDVEASPTPINSP